MSTKGRPRTREYKCKECGEPISQRKAWRSGLCDQCGWSRVLEAAQQLRAKEGPIYEKWLAAYRAAMQRLLEEKED